MRACAPALAVYLASIQATGGGGAMLMADCYTFTLKNGLVLRYSDKDVPITVNGNVFSATSVRVSGLRYKCAVGLDVDSQELDIIAEPTEMAGTVPFFVALRVGLFDACGVTRDRAFFELAPGGLAASYAAPAIGSINLFTGVLATIDALGRTTAKVTVASVLKALDMPMPRNQFQPNCNHALFDSGCTLSKAAYASSGAVGAGSTVSSIVWSGATSSYTQGTITMTSGVLDGLTAGIKQAGSGALTLMLPFEQAPAVGDTFEAYPGCDHTLGPNGCAKFANQTNFRGFPYIPPATSTYASGS